MVGVMKQVVIVDYGMGNLNSVKRKLTKIGVESTISSDPEQMIAAHKIVIPGVGHFKKAVGNLQSSGLWDALNNAALIQHVPVLGICLGMQIMAKHSEEGDVDGLGWFNANVIRFKVNDQLQYKIPHMGWNTVKVRKTSPLFFGLPENPEFYFVHSYHCQSHDLSEVLANTIYEYDFCSALEKDNIFGLQFHPEKSHDVGEQLLRNFARL
jgi:imidazole glycerol-phosphate synthase subunit HisH